MNTLSNAQSLLNQMERASTLVQRMQQNRAYIEHRELGQFEEILGHQLDTVRILIRNLERLQRIDPSGRSSASDWRQADLDFAAVKEKFEIQVQRPLAQLLEETEGQDANFRWFEESKGSGSDPKIKARERWATIVGIDDYDYSKTGFSRLSTSRMDATKTYDLLLTDEMYLSDPPRCVLLRDQEATHDTILKRAEESAQAADSDDMLIFFFSGHGDLAEGQPFLVPYDYYEKKTAGIPIDKIFSILKSSRARVKIVILDACHSGPDLFIEGEERKDAAPIPGMPPEFYDRTFDLGSGMAVITSCTANQSSYSYKISTMSAFTYFLLEGLKGYADVDNRGYVTVNDAFHYTGSKVMLWSFQTFNKIRQVPTISYTAACELILFNYPGKLPAKQLPPELQKNAGISPQPPEMSAGPSRFPQERRLLRGDIFPQIVDAALSIEPSGTAKNDARQEIAKYIREGSILPSSFFYVGDSGYRNWISLIRDPDYTYYHQAMEFYRGRSEEIAEKIRKCLGTKNIDYVSLGPGDGAKDKLLLRWFVTAAIEDDAEVYYYPIDLNTRILAAAVQEVSGLPQALKRLRIKAIIADFATVGALRPVYQYRDVPKVFTLLGNTLGNNPNDLAFLRQLYSVMHDDDVLLLEVSTKTDTFRPDQMDSFKVFDCGPLDILGIPYDPTNLQYEQEDLVSSIPGTRTTIARYPSLMLEGIEYRNIPLSYIHAYERRSFCDSVEKLGFRIVATLPEEDQAAKYLILILSKVVT